MITDATLANIAHQLEEEFPGVKANFRQEEDHRFIRGIGLEHGEKRQGWVVLPDADEATLIGALRKWCEDLR